MLPIDTMPNDFVYLRDVAPTIVQDIRYTGSHNFMGHPMKGYDAHECIVTRNTALALAKAQQALKASSLSLKVYDCYRPQIAVDAIIAWSKQPQHQEMKNEFYPRVDKQDIFKLNYVAAKSGHTRGSTVDLTIVPIPTPVQEQYKKGQPLIPCIAPYKLRFRDNSIDMGTGYDCMDKLAHYANRSISDKAYANRMQLQSVMMKYGFAPYPQEWWHFTLKNEPYPQTYFNFPIKAKD